MKIVVLAFLLASCATTAAGVRRDAEQRLRDCAGYGPGQNPLSASDKIVCMEESEAFCKQNGLDPNCGSDELWTDPLLITPSH